MGIRKARDLEAQGVLVMANRHSPEAVELMIRARRTMGLEIAVETEPAEPP